MGDCSLLNSFCASMMINVLSLGDAVDGPAPSISRRDLTCVAEAIIVAVVVLVFWVAIVVVVVVACRINGGETESGMENGDNIDLFYI